MESLKNLKSDLVASALSISLTSVFLFVLTIFGLVFNLVLEKNNKFVIHYQSQQNEFTFGIERVAMQEQSRQIHSLRHIYSGVAFYNILEKIPRLVDFFNRFQQEINEKKAINKDNITILDTNDLKQKSDSAIGHIFGFLDINKKPLVQDYSDQTATLVFVGDIMLSRGINNLMKKNNDWRYPFFKIADFLKNADLTFGNLEGPISKRGSKSGSIFSFKADPRSIEGILYSGFDVLSIANNHIWDYGSEAFADTLKILKDNNIEYTGGGVSHEEAHRPVIREIKGIKIAFLAYTNLLPQSLGLKSAKPAVAFLNKEQIIFDVRKTKLLADIVVVSFHWGEEYKIQHNYFQENFAHLAIDAGASLVIGHHPHVVQEVEKYNNGYIAYSLGNFVFDQNFSDDTKFGLTLKVILKNKKIFELKKQIIKFNNSFQPFFVSQSLDP